MDQFCPVWFVNLHGFTTAYLYAKKWLASNVIMKIIQSILLGIVFKHLSCCKETLEDLDSKKIQS